MANAVVEDRSPSNPGFVDLQLNGYAGVDFNSDGATIDALRHACDALARDGVASCLATIITDDLERMCSRLQAIVLARDADEFVQRMIGGIHIEGPFLLPREGFIGAHPVAATVSANLDDARRLLVAAGGLTRIFTLAPECDPGLAVTRFLADEGIIVAAGHCDPSLDQLKAAIDAGLSMFTHLGNGCPAILPRHDNIIQRVLSLSDQLWIGLIADGFHVPAFALRNYLKIAGVDRCVVVTDAIAAAGMGVGRFSLGKLEVEVGDDLVPRLPGTSLFAGSAATMPRMVETLRNDLRLGDEEIFQLVRDNPTRILQDRGQTPHVT